MTAKGEITMPVLYVVATPIGNLEDISLRALRILREVALIAAEDTRKARILLHKYDIKTPVTSYYEHNKLTKLEFILNKLHDGDVALISDAGTPGINDPGYELIRAAITRDITVVPVPGASIVAAALTVSGLPTDRFIFTGYLPNRAGPRRRFLETISRETATIVTLEAPHRITESLKDILTVLGDRNIAVCRELTKIHEEIFRGPISHAVEHFKEPRGEFALVIEGSQDINTAVMTPEIEKQLMALHNTGISAKEAVKQLSAVTGLSRRDLYQKWLQIKDSH